MKRTMTKIGGTVLVLLLSLCLLFSSCASLAWVEPTGNGFVHSQSGIRYVYAPTGYAAGSLEASPVAKTRGELLGTVDLYPVRGLPVEKFLCSFEGVLLCAEGISLPTFEELRISSIGIYRVSDGVAIAATSKKETVDQVRSAFRQGAWFERNLISTSIRGQSYELRFAADGEYAGLCYVLRYLMLQEDVLIYENIESAEEFESSYAGVPVRIVELTSTDEATGETVRETCAEYNFGKTLLWDPYRGICCMAGEALASCFE